MARDGIKREWKLHRNTGMVVAVHKRLACGVVSPAVKAAPARLIAVAMVMAIATVSLAIPTPAAARSWWQRSIASPLVRTPTPPRAQARQAAADSGNVIGVPGDVATLQAAIEQVVDGGVIELAAGTYASPSGGWVINNRLKSFTIRAASGATVNLDGGSARDILRLINSSLSSARPVTFQNLIFQNGLSSTDGIGGALSIQRGEATFVGCTFQNNRNDSNTGGGGLAIATGSIVYFDNCLWSGNSARTNGGGLALATASTAFIHDSRFLNNRTNLANHVATAAGGGVHVTNSTLRVTNTRFEGNQAGYVGGGLYVLGSWQDPVGTPAADVTVANCTFINNQALRDASVNFTAPTEGGGLHAEDQATLRVFNSRLVTNSANVGGGINAYRAIVEVSDSEFEGNRATGIGTGNGFGGAISLASNDVNDSSTNNGAINRRSASLAMHDSLIHGRFGSVTSVAQIAGAIYVGGDNNRQFGQGGVTQMGTLATNRATATLDNVAIYDCDVQETSGASGTGNGGGIFADLGALTMTNSLVLKNDASAQFSYGGGIAMLKSSANLTNCTIAGNTAVSYGAGIFAQGSDLNINGGALVNNEISPGVSESATQSFGAAIFTAPDTGLNLNMTGAVTNAVISSNIGLPLSEDDHQNGPINDVRYNGNQIYSTTFGTTVFNNPISGTRTVAQLNSLTISRSGAASTTKSQSANSAPGSAPLVGAILAVPPSILPNNANGDSAPPTTSYLAYAWSGGSASLDSSSVSGNAGLSAASGTGTHTLTVGGTPFTVNVAAGADPTATFTASPPTISGGGTSTLAWSLTAGAFLDAAIDQSVDITPAAAGTVDVSPDVGTTYRYFGVAEEGGVVNTAAVSVNGTPPMILSFTANPVLVTSGAQSTIAWSTAGNANLTFNNVAVTGPSGSLTVNPTGTTSYTLRATNAYGSVQQTVTVSINTGSTGKTAPTITQPAPGQTIGVEGVTFTWNAVSGATAYDLRLFQANSGALMFSGSLVGGSSTSTLLSVPTNGPYLFAIRACTGNINDTNCSRFATRNFTVSLVAPSAAPTVTAPSAGAQLTTSRQTLSWTTVAGNPALPDLFYEVTLTNLGDGSTELQLRTAHPTASTDAVLRSGDYRLRVRACQAACGPYSDPVDFHVSLPAVPSAKPTITSATVSNGNQLNAAWTAAARAEWYQVQVVQPPPAGPGGGALTVASRQVVGATSVSGLPVPIGQAFVIVAACNGDGCGPYSNGATINPAGPNPSAPIVGVPIGESVVSGPSVLFAWSRIPGDTGSNVTYRVYVQDLSRQSAALDVLTTQNYYGALLKAEGAKYAVVIIANPGLQSQIQGPGLAFTVRGNSAVAPTLIAPTYASTVSGGNILMAWSPVPGATLYEYYVARQGQSTPVGRGVNPGLFVQVPLFAVGGQPTVYSSIVRACPAGNTCVFGSDTGWGPWSDVAGTGANTFTVSP